MVVVSQGRRMSGNGFKSPAPVLPGLGLHSFHNDSPPFAGAATSEAGEPPVLNLETTNGHPGAGPRQGSVSRMPTLGRTSSQAEAIPEHPTEVPESKAISTLKSIQSSPSPPVPSDFPPTSVDKDDEFSQSRSRRLVSGYLFGNPPSPTGANPTTTPLTATSHSHPSTATAATAEESQEPQASRRLSPTLEGTRYVGQPRLAELLDSPPLSDAEAGLGELRRDMREMDMDGTPPPPDAASEAGPAPGGVVSLNEPLGADAGAGPGLAPRVAARKSERSRKAETGYDALEGRNDGEADLDLSAPQAEGGGSGAYLAGKAPYSFPRHRLRTKMHDESKIPVVIVACGSFSPPTYLHLRMFEMAKDEIVESQTYEIMAGYYSPVSSYYKKSGLAPAPHRVRMCELAVEHTSTWLMVDPWEAGQPEYQRTAVVLDHFDRLLNGGPEEGEQAGENGGGGVVMKDGKRRRYKIMLLAGGDLIESFGEPGVWSEPDLHEILGRFGCLIVERAGSDVWAFLLSHDILYHHRRNVVVIKQLIYNDISSTKVRLFVRRGMSIKYLLPNSVIQYIIDHKLYRSGDGKKIA
ncbi:nicotinate (nicotinamide) nucleotide adenylyltransferase [Cryptococcus amylolentus CBS 6039]|uniref:Nicotinate (Nicotinamide) nucleotide adenylyltransferase n=2 Tax=Cryptococcus amylolentus CBS 6039 TaxID=1295533 RepID=A0A1E3HXP7_9TREE|nr:nicotinate (nicotinamide) nucleotide adenylyltransferase [Cryptococcus amylolentus CBS 6039]ODN81102.1 nicotinate (nicotinamide) nucleotide adenylyltransferase [Cryptococcus amylolentus CBS 6039]